MPLEVETLRFHLDSAPPYCTGCSFHNSFTINHLAFGFLFMSPGFSLPLARALKISDQAFRADSEGCGANLYCRPSASTHCRQGSLRNITRLEPGLSHDANGFRRCRWLSCNRKKQALSELRRSAENSLVWLP
jgi:hypothetical protein